jgi:hypothetical protein
MTSIHQRREIKVLAVFAVAAALLLLLLAQSSSSHNVPPIWLALAPVFLFALVDIRPSEWLPVSANRVAKRHQIARSALFQRPPPSA